MSDGVRLAADLWLPDREGKFPAILTYLPYHKDGFAGARIMEHLPYFFAKNGYCYAIVDVRGTGSSEGVCTEIYSLQEQKDGYEVVEWLASQLWSNGNIGMLGWSYGFTSTVLVAAQNPPHLKAILPFYGNVNLYDALWEGGSFLGFHFAGYLGSLMVVMNAMPPGHRDGGGRWIEMWRDRIVKNTPWLFDWVKYQTDGEYWRTKSIASGYDRIKVPTLTIAGWNDIYPSWPPLFFQNIDSPKKILLGPWLHQEPNKSRVGPRLDYYPLILRWFDSWLKGSSDGGVDEPPILLYTAEYTPPDVLRNPSNPWMNGSWRYERKLPIEGTRQTEFYLERNRALSSSSSLDNESLPYEYDPTVGLSAGLIGGVYTEVTLPVDQRPDEAKSLVFDSPPLESDMEVTGQPVAILFVSSTADVAGFSVKLCDEAPDGTTVLVSRYYLNATRRESSTNPEPLKPGEIYELKISMNFVSYRFLEGHRIKFMVSSADFPHIWPTPKSCTNTLHVGQRMPSRLVLPVVPNNNRSTKDIELPAIDLPPRGKERLLQPDLWLTSQDMSNSTVSVEWRREAELFPDENTKLLQKWWIKARTQRRRPADSRMEARHRVITTQLGSEADCRSRVTIQSDENFFHVYAKLNIDYNGVPHARRVWSEIYPRNLC